MIKPDKEINFDRDWLKGLTVDCNYATLGIYL